MLLLLILSLLTADPVTWVGETTVDLGDLLHDEPVTHTFTFENHTDGPLVIDNIRTGCGCTAAEWEEVAVPQGKRGRILITYDAANVGYFRKYVKVYFRGVRGAHKLWLEGYVEAD